MTQFCDEHWIRLFGEHLDTLPLGMCEEWKVWGVFERWPQHTGTASRKLWEPAPISTAWLVAAPGLPHTWCLALPLCWVCGRAPAQLLSACVWRLLDEAPLHYAFLHPSVHLRNCSSSTLLSLAGCLRIFKHGTPSCMCTNICSSQGLALSVSRWQPG